MTARPHLTRPAAALRAVHALIAVVELASLGYVWRCAITGRRGAHLGKATAVLVGEGAALVVGGGDCPLGPLQQRTGDATPLFELVLRPDAARRAVPVLAAVATTGVLLAIVRVR